MKAAVIIWNIVLVAAALFAGLVRCGPMVYEQAHFQFNDPRGGPSMWPATFEVALRLIAFFACLAALSYLFNRNLGRVTRVVAGALTVLLLGAWLVSGILWIRYDYPGSLYGFLMGFDGLVYIAVAILAFGLTAVLGRGPVTLMAETWRRITTKQVLRPSA